MNMVTHACAYKISDKLGTLEDGEVNILPKSDILQLVRDTVKRNFHLHLKLMHLGTTQDLEQLNSYRVRKFSAVISS